jgi:hypothetical protein
MSSQFLQTNVSIVQTTPRYLGISNLLLSIILSFDATYRMQSKGRHSITQEATYQLIRLFNGIILILKGLSAILLNGTVPTTDDTGWNEHHNYKIYCSSQWIGQPVHRILLIISTSD